jgi:hypothetical protein
MAEAAGFIVVVQFSYRGTDEEWSQGYHIADAWVDEADFRATMDSFRVEMANVVSERTTFLRFIGYQDRSLPHDFVYDISGSGLTGAFDTTGLTPMPGDTAAWVRWPIARRSTRGKPIYLRKYFHDVYATEDLNPDALANNQRLAMDDFGDNARTGVWDGHVIADRLGATTTVRDINDNSIWLTTRTLEKRGRRRPPP